MGDHRTSVPPLIVISTEESANAAGSIKACRTMAMLPAVLISILNLPPLTNSGLKEISLAPKLNPSHFAFDNWATAFIAFKCWGINPGLDLFARIFFIYICFNVKAERAADIRIIAPPPSPYEPSISTI